MPNWKKLTGVGHGEERLIVYVNVDQVLYITVFGGTTRLYFSGGTNESPRFIDVEERVADIQPELISVRGKLERDDLNKTTFALRERSTKWRELFAVVVSLSLAAAIYFYFASWNLATLIGKFVTTGSVIK